MVSTPELIQYFTDQRGDEMQGWPWQELNSEWKESKESLQVTYTDTNNSVNLSSTPVPHTYTHTFSNTSAFSQALFAIKLVESPQEQNSKTLKISINPFDTNYLWLHNTNISFSKVLN